MPNLALRNLWHDKLRSAMTIAGVMTLNAQTPQQPAQPTPQSPAQPTPQPQNP